MGNLQLGTGPARSNGKHPGGRPRYVFTPEQLEDVERLAEIACTQTEVAYVLGICDVECIDNHEEFIRAYQKGLTHGNKSLRRRQYELCFSKNEAVANIQLIWQGKQRLGQTDRATEYQVIEQRHSFTFVLPSGLELRPGELIEGEARVVQAGPDSPDSPG